MTHSNFSTPELPTPAIGVSGILFNEIGEVLLIKRGQPPAVGLWSIPGGRLEPGETLAIACKREYFEETGLNVVVKNVVAVVERKLEGFHYIIIDFIVELFDKTNNIAVAQSDVLEARWVKLNELNQLQIVEGLTEIIQGASLGQSGTCGLHASAVLSDDFILPSLLTK